MPIKAKKETITNLIPQVVEFVKKIEGVDKVSVKNGNIVAKRAFFYRRGVNQYTFWGTIRDHLQQAIINKKLPGLERVSAVMAYEDRNRWPKTSYFVVEIILNPSTDKNW